MTEQDRLVDILGAWHEARDRGEAPDVEALMQEHPELAGDLERHARAMRVLDGVFGTSSVRGYRVPARLGVYGVADEIGAGGMGTVFRAVVEEATNGLDVGTPVAIKVVHPHLLQAKGSFPRFHREIELGRMVDHPNVVKTYDFDVEIVDGIPFCYLVMELVEGQTLRELLQGLGNIPEGLIREVGRQVAEGLAAIHGRGAVHRDLKPENVLITKDHRIRLMDLGVARLPDASQVLTQDGHFAGSLAYAAPEQFQAGDVGSSADLYALGVLLHELATGSNPFRRDGFAAVMRAHLEETPPRITEVEPDLSEFLAELVGELLAKEAGERPTSAAAVATLLREGEASSWWGAREAALRARARRIPRVPVRRETKLHGRDEDLALLTTAWKRARQGAGNTVLVEGEAGIGKSRLVDTFIQGLGHEDAHVLYGSFAPASGASGIRDAILAKLGEGDLESSLRPLLAGTPDLVGPLAALLTEQASPQDASALQGDVLHAALVHLMRGLAQEKPLLWVVEDLHFAPEEDRKLALSLARAVEGHEILLVLTTRPELPEQERAHFGRLENVQSASLRRLGAREVIELLQDAFRSERLAEKLGGKIALKSDGIPFFVFEMIRGLKEGNFITELPDGSWVESEVIEDIEVPDTVRELIQARMRGLSDEERTVLDVGAVQGFEFDPDLVAEALGRPRVSVLQSLAALERRSGVVRGEGRRVRFDHHHLQEVLYAELMPALREEYHVLLAQAYEARGADGKPDRYALGGGDCVFLCEHFLKGAQGVRARRYLDAALDHLEAAHLNDQAVALADRALATPGALEGRVRLGVLLRKNSRLDLLGRREVQEETLAEAMALADKARDPGTLIKASIALGTLAARRCRYEEAKAYFQRVLSLARETGNREGEAMATGNLGLVSLDLGRPVEAKAHLEHVLFLTREIGDRKGEVSATLSLGRVLQFLGHPEEALAHYERAFTGARETGDRPSEGDAMGNLGALLLDLGHLEEAKAHFEQHLALAGEIGDRLGEARATRNLGVVMRALGFSEQAKAHNARALALAREIGDRQGEAHARRSQGNVAHDLGYTEEARDHLEHALTLAREIGDRHGEVHATGSLGVVFADLGRLAEAKVQYERALTLAREIGNRRDEALSLSNLGALWLDLGCPTLARSALKESRRIHREMDARCEEGYVLKCLGVAAQEEGNRGGALDLTHEALALLRDVGDGYGIAGSLLQVAELHQQSGNDGAACDALHEAVDLLRHQNRKPELGQTLAFLATLPGGDAAEAEAALEGAGDAGNMPETRYYLWKATGKPEHLAEAKRLLDSRLEHAPEEYRDAMLKNVRLNREIESASKALHPE